MKLVLKTYEDKYLKSMNPVMFTDKVSDALKFELRNEASRVSREVFLRIRKVLVPVSEDSISRK